MIHANARASARLVRPNNHFPEPARKVSEHELDVYSRPKTELNPKWIAK